LSALLFKNFKYIYFNVEYNHYPDHVANQIAGEVVQRPASVVKELLENAVDAGATDIKLIKDAGKALVQVVDNGLGMSVTDARLSLNVMLHQNP
jgi:DNA mismatch repair protein MutL